MKQTQMRGLTDKDLQRVLFHHREVLDALARATNTLLRERRLLLVLGVVQTAAVVYLLWAVA